MLGAGTNMLILHMTRTLSEARASDIADESMEWVPWATFRRRWAIAFEYVRRESGTIRDNARTSGAGAKCSFVAHK